MNITLNETITTKARLKELINSLTSYLDEENDSLTKFKISVSLLSNIQRMKYFFDDSHTFQSSKWSFDLGPYITALQSNKNSWFKPNHPSYYGLDYPMYNAVNGGYLEKTSAKSAGTMYHPWTSDGPIIFIPVFTITESE